MTRVLLLGAGGSAAANVLDSLRQARHQQYTVIGADASPVKLHLSSADERLVVPRADEPGYAEAVLGAVEKWRCDVVHAQPDPDVRAIGSFRDRIHAATFLPEQDVIELAADKLRATAVLERAGVPVPDSCAFSTLESVVPTTRALLKKHESVWVRARVGAGARASLPVSRAEQADAWVRWWWQERSLPPGDFMASERLPGREFAYQSLWQDGVLVAGQARERVEYLYGHLTPSGQTSTPSVARTVADERVDRLAQLAIRALDRRPNGVYCVDLKESATGEPKVTEINAGRFFTTSNFFAAAGLNMPDMLMRCALGERISSVGSSPLPPDLYWVRMVDMGYVLVNGNQLDAWPRAGR